MERVSLKRAWHVHRSKVRRRVGAVRSLNTGPLAQVSKLREQLMGG